MAKEYLDKDGLLYFWQKIKNTFALVSHTHTKSDITDFPTIPSKTSDLTNDSNFVSDANYVHTDNNYTSTEKTKLSGIATGAEVNQNAFSNVKVGSTTVAADGKTDTLELVAGSNVTITPDATNDKVTIAATDTVYTHPTYTEESAAAVKVGRDVTGHVVIGDALTKSDVGLGSVDNTADSEKSVASAAALTTARKIDGVNFDGSADIIHYGTCDTASGTVAKTVSCTGFNLVTGALIFVKFSNAVSSGTTNITLNVNSTGAKNIVTPFGTLTGAIAVQNGIMCKTAQVHAFVYNGASYSLITDSIFQTMSAAQALSTGDEVGRLISPKVLNARIAAYGGVANGFAQLDSSGKVPSSQLPSYVDDVIEAYPISSATELSSGWLSETSSGSALTPETGKIYVLMADSTSYAANSQFCWSGTAYVKLADGGVSSITNAEIDTIVAS